MIVHGILIARLVGFCYRMMTRVFDRVNHSRNCFTAVARFCLVFQQNILCFLHRISSFIYDKLSDIFS